MPTYAWVAFGILGLGLLVLVGSDMTSTDIGVDPGILASIVAAAALIVFLGPGLARRGATFGTYVRQAALWIALLLALIAGYTIWQNLG